MIVSSLISAEVGAVCHPLALSEGPRPVFEERDVNEPERDRKRDEERGLEMVVSHLNPARCLFNRLSVVVRSPTLHKRHS